MASTETLFWALIVLLTILQSVYTQDAKAEEEAAKAAGNHSLPEENIDGEWSYDNATGPDMWSKIGYPKCGGDLQSPINIDTESIAKYEYNDLFNFAHYKDVASKVTVQNNGHTLVARFEYEPVTSRPTVSGGQLSGTYEFEQLHFHWGHRGDKKYNGAEHTIDGVRAPLEMHMVHRNIQYKTMAEAVNHTDGILVLATIFEMNTNNVMPLLLSVESVKDLVAAPQGSATLKPRALATVLPSDTTGFFRYRGSLTTPGCQESVEWVVFEQRGHVIIGQVKMLTGLTKAKNETISHNFRPTQKLNGRKIYHMIYKNPGHVVTESSAPVSPRPIQVIYCILTISILVCNTMIAQPR